MGRVRKYRKIKACDPFSKRKPNNEKDLQYDESPDIFEERAENKRKRKVLNWDNENDRERLLQQQARKDLKESKSIKADNATSVTLKIREGESLASFSKRVKAETRKTLATELTKLSSSTKRKKVKLQQLKERREQKKNKHANEDEVREFGSREDGYIRASDRNDSKTDFDSYESIAFGERVDCPPDLNKWATKFTKKQPQTNREQQLEEVKQEAILAYQKLKAKRKAEAEDRQAEDST